MSDFSFEWLGLLIAGVLLALGGVWLDRWKKKRKLNRIFEDRYQHFDHLLARYNPYYKSLGMTGRQRFSHRVPAFMETKNFEYIDIQPEERMPLLISAAAVQVTYGLGNFQLDYFRTIYVIKD